ncbi:MAG: Tat pathway signal protein [Prevotella sp.]
MQQTTIQFGQAQPMVARPADVAATLRQMKERADKWLDSRSEFFSRIGEMPVTWRLAIRVNVVTACIVVTALAIEAAPLAAITSLATAMWLTYRFNHTNKKGGRS